MASAGTIVTNPPIRLLEAKSTPPPESPVTSEPVQNSSQNAPGGSVHTGPKSPSAQELPKYKHLFAVHTTQNASVLTSGEGPTPNFNGFRNLMLLVILTSNMRLMIENFRKYGVLICLRCHDYRKQDVILGTILYLMVPCSLFIAYNIERRAASKAKEAIGQAKKLEQDHGVVNADGTPTSIDQSFKSSWRMIALCQALNATLNLLVATYVVYYHIYHPGIGTLCELHAVIVWLKTCSYVFTNRDLRHAYLSAAPESSLPEVYSSCSYPNNVTLGNLTYFWWAPTLVYQPVYPRTTHIRWLFVAKRAAEVAILSIAIWIASAQYAVPLLRNSLSTISTLNLTSFLERLMKLSSISLFCWLAGFFALFQSFLNLLAEIMRFADRRFYDDWWNSPNIRSYWSSWNRPVYQFMKRHVYAPLVARGCPAILAQVFVFVLSGILHEMLVGVPTHNIIGVAFVGMMFQLPLIFTTDILTKIKGLGGATTGNVIFWISFVLVGQPLAALLYFFAWQAKYGSVSKPEFPFSSSSSSSTSSSPSPSR